MNCCVTNIAHYKTKIEIERKIVSEYFCKKPNNIDKINYF